MKKIQPQYTHPVYMAIIVAMTLVYVIRLFILMTYDKRAVRVATTDYVREVTRWPGHTHVNNIPVQYE